MRDINDDLRKEPFNDEMKHIAYGFATLLKSIVETIDWFGLKARHLHKHRRSVDRFYDALSQRNYQTELATGYRRRFEKYRLPDSYSSSWNHRSLRLVFFVDDSYF